LKRNLLADSKDSAMLEQLMLLTNILMVERDEEQVLREQWRRNEINIAGARRAAPG